MVTVTFDKEEAVLRGYIPLEAIEALLKKGEKVEMINFKGNGYCTDAVLRLFSEYPKEQFTNLKEVNLKGCCQLTDHGIFSLIDVLKASNELEKVDLSGCELLTDNSFSMLKKLTVKVGCMCDMKGTGVNYLTGSSQVMAIPSPASLILPTGKNVDFLHGQALVVPDPSLSHSVAEYLTTGQLQEVKAGSHKADVKMGDWTMAINEIPQESHLFDSAVNTTLTQILIPFDASAEPKDIQKHVMTTIARVVAKEPVSMKFPTVKPIIQQSGRNWMDCSRQDKIHVEEGKIMRNITRSEDNIGVFVGHTPFTRSNPYFEIKCVETTTDELAILLGCLMDFLFNIRHPMDSQDDHGGVVDGFELKEGQVIGFGISGEWVSEYVPSSDCKFVFTVDGVEKKGKVDLDEKDVPRSGMYPLVTVLGNSGAAIEFGPLTSPPEALMRKYEKEKRWADFEYISNIVIDNDGIATYMTNYNTSAEPGLFISRQPMSMANDSFSIKILDVDTAACIEFGVGPENYKYSDTTMLMSVGKCLNIAPGKTEECIYKVKVGDILTVKVEGFETLTHGIISSTASVKVTFLHNNKQVYCVPDYNYKVEKEGVRLVPIVKLVYNETKPARVQLLSYMPTYRAPAPITDKITMGRAHYMDVLDNGSIEYKKFFEKDKYGMFMAKTPLNKNLLSFDVDFVSVKDKMYFGIGLAPSYYSCDSFVGWQQGSLAYHGDNGQLYINSGSGTTEYSKVPPEEAVVAAGDKMTCRVEPVSSSSPLKFDADGNVASQQKVKIVFLKNDKVVNECQYEHLADGLYPTISLRDSVANIHNFYPETSEIWALIESKTMEKKDSKEPETSEGKKGSYHGYEFQVVSVSSGQSDPSGKLQIVQQQLDPGDMAVQLDSAIADMKQHLGELDFQDQMLLSRLLSVKDNFNMLQQHWKDRVTFKTLDLKSGQGRKEILSEMEKCQNKHKTHQPERYWITKRFADMYDKIMMLLKKEGMLTFHQLNFTDEVDSAQMESITELLQATGCLLLLRDRDETLLMDYTTLLEVESKLTHLSPTALSDNRVTCISQTSHVWDDESLKKSIFSNILPEKMEKFIPVVQDILGLIRLTCLRTGPTDTMYIYVTRQNLSTPPTSMTDYYSSSLDNKDFVVMKQTYKFPLSLPKRLLSHIFSRATKYGRVILLSSEGTVCQNGAVQTVIICNHNAGDDPEIVIESRCYMPDLKSQPETTLSKETVSYVRDYTWNIFCIYTDVIDCILATENIVAAVNKTRHNELVNVGVGCKHAWVFREEKVKQTVCTLCNFCCDKGTSCRYNGIMGNCLRECGCGTEIIGCEDCGICKSCATALWDIRSKLRPFAGTTTEVLTTVSQRLAMKKSDSKDLKDKVEKMMIRDPIQQPYIPLDPFMYNEVEFVNLCADAKVLCLREENDGTTVQAFPGRASYLEDADNLSSIMTMSHTPGLRLRIGDTIKIRIQDPHGASYVKRNAVQVQDEGKVEPQYFALFGREVKVCHETGSLFYDTASQSVPVGQFIGTKPLSKSGNSFSIKILAKGQKCTIAMGLVPKNYGPNRQPGWNSQSIGYHADDGGVFLESGKPTRITQECGVGDVMSFTCDFEKNKGFFYKNGKQAIELNLNPSRLGFYPCIGFHSVGEAVQLLEKEVWQTENPSDASVRPPAFTTYKYGNLWISPGYKMVYSKIGNNYYSWLLLHNPSKDPVGVKVGQGVAASDKYVLLQHKEDFVHSFSCTKDTIPEEVNIEWQSLELGRKYTDKDIEQLFAPSESVSQSNHNHRLRVVIQESSNVMEELPVCGKGVPLNKDVLKMEIYRNSTLVNDYWLKYGNYYVTVETNKLTCQFVLKYPKCPTFLFPKYIQKGMKLVICLNDKYAECIVVDLYNGGKMLALEYSPEDSDLNSTICILANSPALNFTEFSEDSAKVLGYQTRNTPATLTQTFVWAPPYLLSEGGFKSLKSLDSEWKANTLRSVSQCAQVFTRLTVQEQNICNASKKLVDWLKVESNYMFSYLPNPFSVQSLCYPHCSDMFSDLAVHRLCFCVEEVMMQSSMDDSLMWRIPLHFIDMEPVVPQKALPIDVLYTNNSTAWMYCSLIADKLLLPSYSRLIQGDTESFSRGQIELMMWNLLQSYASLCGIFCAKIGGIDKSEPAADGRVIYQSLEHKMDQIVKFKGEPILEDNVLIKHSGSFTCKAHVMNAGGNEIKFPNGLEFKYEYFEPYNELVSTFAWKHRMVDSLPDDFFEKFPNLQLFSIGNETSNMPRLKRLPEGLSKLKDLHVVRIVNTGMTELPSDILMSPTAYEVSCWGMPVKQIPDQVNEKSRLRRFRLSHTMVSEIPASLGQLQLLEELSLSHNLITDLPDSLSKLTKLRILKLTGVPWITFEGTRSSMPIEHYYCWHQRNPTIDAFLGEEKVEQLFHQYDTNLNGSLDEEEVANLGAYLFLNIPRLGSKDLNDEATGGIPPVIFSLKSLNKLDLDFQAITMVPQSINNLQNLNSLNLKNNPLLESLPGTLGHLPNIKNINLMSCPMLRTPPPEVVGRGFESVKAYLKRLAGGFIECRRTKLMVVGLGGAGKTSLLRALMSAQKTTTGSDNEVPTDGIDIVPWTIASKDGTKVTYSTWDFAGQAVYYNTHQFFFSKRAVYLLLWSMRQGYEHAGLDFWLSSISCHAPGTPIIVVGTQCDLIPKAEVPEKAFRERYPQIVSFHRVSSIKGIGIADLEQKLLDVTLAQGYMGEKIPQVWLNFENRIIAERQTKKNYLKWDVVQGYAMEAGIYDEKDARLAVQLLHDLGTLQYFDNDFLQDYVVINPQWIVNVMACVVSAQESKIQKNNGRFLHSDIPSIWKDYDEELRPWLLRLTEDFDLTFPLPKEPINVVPCLLPQEEPGDLNWPSIRDKHDIRETKMVYRFTYLPSGLFNRAQVRLFQFSDNKHVWKKGSLLSKNNHLALIKQTDDSELVVYVQGRRPENILFLIHEVFESIVEESFNGVSYDFFVPCPDCIVKEGTFDPCLFSDKLVKRAKDMKAPFLQCYKFFHWISMAQIQEKMPADSREVADFDLQLQQSLVALQHLNDELIKDTAIIYSKFDLESSDENALTPLHLRDDILKWGYQCEFPENMDTVSFVDLTAAAKNCRVLIACVSDEFERDTKCRDLFLYAKETMNKEIITVVLGESMEWQNKDLGMKIGRQERMLMAKNLSRYKAARQAELHEWLNEKLTQQKSENVFPDIFISYCWANSANASEKSGKVKPGALGFADPRHMKAALSHAGLNCWIDIENIGKERKGIFADMAVGIRNSKVMLACVSDEYADSDNCMMELRFGILNMELPLVVATVGTGNEWKETEVAMLLRRAKAPEVNLQKENPSGFEALIKFCKDALIDVQLRSKKKADTKASVMAKEMLTQEKEKFRKAEKDKISSIAYQEEIELLQRRFMRHILGTISNMNNLPVPRLLVVDFVRSAKSKADKDGRESKTESSTTTFKSKKILRPKSSTRSRDRLQTFDISMLDDDESDWTSESFCIRFLCENDEGWHLCEKMFPLAFRNHEMLDTFLKRAAPYLFRIYSILTQSPIKLKCFTGQKGEAYQNWITKESEDNLDFVGALQHLRQQLNTDEAADFVDCLARCRLPSGKIVWLCDEHQKGEHVSKLSTSSTGGVHNVQKVVYPEDTHLRENLEMSKEYRRRKGIKSDKVAPKQAPAPVPKPASGPPSPPPVRAPTRPPADSAPPPSQPPPPPQAKETPEEKKKEKKSENIQSGKTADKLSPTKPTNQQPPASGSSNQTLSSAQGKTAAPKPAPRVQSGKTSKPSKTDHKNVDVKGSKSCVLQ